MITVEEHRARCLAAVAPPAPVRVPLLDALGLLLAEDVVSPLVLPPFDNSAMDGFAVRAAELAGVTDAAPRELPVAGEVAAGAGEPRALEPGTAVRIMTGAPVPPGADAVVPVEWTGGWTDGRRTAGASWCTARRSPGSSSAPRAGTSRPGRSCCAPAPGCRPATSRCSPPSGATPSPSGPRRAWWCCPTGTELVPLGREPGHGQIHDSNGYGLTAAARELGALASYARDRAR